MSIDIRKNRRFPAIFNVTYDSFGAFYKDYTLNISKGGTFILTEHKFRVGQIFKIFISFPKLLEPIPMEVEVIWTFQDSFDINVRKGVGVRFIYKNDYHKKKFEKLIDIMSKELSNEDKKIFKIIFYHPNPFIRTSFSDGLNKLNYMEQYKTINIVVRTLQSDQNIISSFLAENFDLVIFGEKNREKIEFYFDQLKKHNDLIPYIGLDIPQDLGEHFDMILKKPFTMTKIKAILDTCLKISRLKKN